MSQQHELPTGGAELGRHVSVAHVPSVARCYPGDELTLYTRVRVAGGLSSFALTLSVPDGLVVDTTAAPESVLPRRAEDGGHRYLVWRVGEPSPEALYEYEVRVHVAPSPRDLALKTRATVAAQLQDGTQLKAHETATVSVLAKGSYLRWLPALYQRDELMGRFLMLFESFWRPIEQRIAHSSLYLDPLTAPAEFLPWLASWLGLVLDDQLDEGQRRALIRAAASLYRRRGTRQGLIDYLSILGEHIRIIEHSADNLVLGQTGRLGPGIALGTENVPHTFTVLLDGDPSASGDGPVAGQRLRRVRTVIEAEKPAHTGYLVRYQGHTHAQQMEG